jgi:hypothetical protein
MAKGRKTGGRTRGTPNKVTSAAREAFLALFDDLTPDLEGWIRETATGVEQPLMLKGVPVMGADGKPLMVRTGADPGKAADLVIRMAEYHFPKLGRAEITGEDGGALVVNVVTYSEGAK